MHYKLMLAFDICKDTRRFDQSIN